MMIQVEIGQQFDRWTVIATGIYNAGKRASLCECICGNSAIVNNSGLTLGKSRSCGCLRAEKLKWRNMPEKNPPKPDVTARTLSQPCVKPHTGPRLIELTDTRHNAHDGIGSGVRLPRGMSSAAML